MRYTALAAFLAVACLTIAHANDSINLDLGLPNGIVFPQNTLDDHGIADVAVAPVASSEEELDAELMPYPEMFGDDGRVLNLTAMRLHSLSSMSCEVPFDPVTQEEDTVAPVVCPYRGRYDNMVISGVRMNAAMIGSDIRRMQDDFSCTKRAYYKPDDGDGVGYTQNCMIMGMTYKLDFRLYYGAET